MGGDWAKCHVQAGQSDLFLPNVRPIASYYLLRWLTELFPTPVRSKVKNVVH